MNMVTLTLESNTSKMPEKSFEQWLKDSNCRVFEETGSIFSNEDNHYVGIVHHHIEKSSEKGCSDWCGTFRN